MALPNPKVSVIIPVRNEALRIRQCIEGIRKQTVSVHEVIVIDSGSTDGTREILSEYPDVTVIEIDGSTFNHGLTRNLGVEASSGDFCLLTVGDAYAYDEHWIQHLLDGFVDDEVLAVCGQQVVDHLPENNPLQWFRPQSIPELRRVQFTSTEWGNLTPLEKKQAVGWDDVNAMYRRNALRQHPFEKTSYSEDAIWAHHALSHGLALAYNRLARVYHYHFEDPDFAFRRALTSHYFRYKLTGYIPTLSEGSWFFKELKLIWSIMRFATKPKGKQLYWWKYNRDRSKAYQVAHSQFHTHLKKGEEALDMYHSELCGKPPIPTKAHLN